MKKIMTNEEKINKINSERKIILEKAKTSLSNSGTLSMNSIDEVVEIVSYDDKNTKEYKAIIAAKNDIANLTKLIIEAKTPEDIASIRRKINYRINKIKRILETRGVTSSKIEKMSQNVSYMRNDIFEYIRLLKRENNINEIVRLNNSFSSLSEEDKNKLKKLLRKEVNYIRRKQSNNTKTIKDYETIKKEHLERLEKINSSLLINNEPDEIKAIIDEFKEKDFSTVLKEKLKKEAKPLDEKDKELSSALKQKLKEAKDSYSQATKEDNHANSFEEFSIRYNVKNLHVYGSSFGKNCIRLIRNIPSYISNNKKVNKMIDDYNIYSNRKDLKKFIEHTKEQNSIKHAIETIFKKSKLFKREKECLNTHEECIDWMDNYLVQNPTRVLTR